jgi:hypothetical protein
VRGVHGITSACLQCGQPGCSAAAGRQQCPTPMLPTRPPRSQATSPPPPPRRLVRRHLQIWAAPKGVWWGQVSQTSKEPAATWERRQLKMGRLPALAFRVKVVRLAPPLPHGCCLLACMHAVQQCEAVVCTPQIRLPASPAPPPPQNNTAHMHWPPKCPHTSPPPAQMYCFHAYEVMEEYPHLAPNLTQAALSHGILGPDGAQAGAPSTDWRWWQEHATSGWAGRTQRGGGGAAGWPHSPLSVGGACPSWTHARARARAHVRAPT